MRSLTGYAKRGYGIEAGLGTLFILTATCMLLVATTPTLRASSP
jgi:hypothetical protein